MPLRVAVIGCGRLGGFHGKTGPHGQRGTRGRGRSTGCEPRSSGRRTAHYPVCSHQALLGCIDAAVIASPTALHHPLAVDLLEAGTHLLIEKPICTTVTEADELVELARRQQLVLQVGHVERFNPALAAATPHARESEIHRGRAGVELYLPLDGCRRCARPDDPRHRRGALAGPFAAAIGRGLGHGILGGHEDVAHTRAKTPVRLNSEPVGFAGLV